MRDRLRLAGFIANIVALALASGFAVVWGAGWALQSVSPGRTTIGLGVIAIGLLLLVQVPLHFRGGELDG